MVSMLFNQSKITAFLKLEINIYSLRISSMYINWISWLCWTINQLFHSKLIFFACLNFETFTLLFLNIRLLNRYTLLLYFRSFLFFNFILDIPIILFKYNFPSWKNDFFLLYDFKIWNVFLLHFSLYYF